jgi:anhydro-N-acetylmuramic acid kinase
MLVAGLISGTSADGIDVALVEIAGAGFRMRVCPLAHCSSPYPPRVRAAVLEVAEPSACADSARGRLCKRGPDRVSSLNFLLGELFAEAVERACYEAKIPMSRVRLIGSHGQTVFHQGKPRKFLGRSIASTLQIGEPAVIAARTGIDVVADFRPGDIAAGGEGAPLVPYVDYLLYRSRRIPRIALNIGGIANITIIPAGAGPEQVAAFDTGPGNMIMDALASRFTGGRLRYDRDGKMAAAGHVDRKLLDNLLAGAYFRRPPPKSAGREQYGAEFVERLLRSGLAAEDLMATATAFTAESIALAVRRFGGGAVTAARKAPVELIVSGGGLRNPQLMAQLVAALPEMRIRTSNDFGIDSDAKEAIAFAVLAYESYHRRPSNLPSATGARRPAVLGKIVFSRGRRQQEKRTPAQ